MRCHLLEKFVAVGAHSFLKTRFTFLYRMIRLSHILFCFCTTVSTAMHFSFIRNDIRISTVVSRS